MKWWCWLCFLLTYLSFLGDGLRLPTLCAETQTSLEPIHAASSSKYPLEQGRVSSVCDCRNLRNPLNCLAMLLAASGPSVTFQASWLMSRQARISSTSMLPTEVAMMDPGTDSIDVPFYTDPELGRDRMRVLQAGAADDVLAAPTSRFVLSQGGKIFGLPPSESGDELDAIFLTPSEIAPSWLEAAVSPDGKGEVVWVGAKDDTDFFVLDVPDDLEVELPQALQARGVVAQPVRQFGDMLRSRGDAAVLAAANGMVNFHRSHRFCAKCGSPTKSAKFGACRRCSNTECGSSVYPRIDPSAIMLVVSPKEVDGGAHALLGRKKRWPRGRFSTLAGFAEVGESIEDCLVREVLEESGVSVDRTSVSFVASQPWPFPRSLMFGFRAHAAATQGATKLPDIDDSIEELEDVQWFSREYVRQRLEGGSTALDYTPSETEAEFHVPGKASLARKLISDWANDKQGT